MERLTYRLESQNGNKTDTTVADSSIVYLADNEQLVLYRNKLAAYEDTGLEPEEIPTGLEMANMFCAMKKLKDYEDAAEQGRLAVLPCKVGDAVLVDVRTFAHGERAPRRYAKALVTSFVFGHRNFIKFRIFSPYVNANRIYKYPLSAVGKTVFLTREEAEAALERSKHED